MGTRVKISSSAPGGVCFSVLKKLLGRARQPSGSAALPVKLEPAEGEPFSFPVF